MLEIITSIFLNVKALSQPLSMSFLSENNFLRKNKPFPVRGKALNLPIYFPSVSSVKSRISPFDCFKILKEFGQGHFLISAYDIFKSKDKKGKSEFINSLKSNIDSNGPIILMDSGNYEKFWLQKKWSINKFNEILKKDICDLAFSFDVNPPPKGVKKNASAIKKSIDKSQGHTLISSVLPIVHSDKEKLSKVVIELFEQTYFTTVAIPERELGEGLLQRVETLTKLRKELNKKNPNTIIHVLGTGNPLSLLLLSIAGADSFDGLEWCQTVVNTRTATLYHLQQLELVNDNCAYCKLNSDEDYILKALGHNLNFYNNWMKIIRDAIISNREMELLEIYFDTTIISQLNKIWA